MVFLRLHFVVLNLLIIYWNIEGVVADDGCLDDEWKCGDQCISYTGTCTCGENDNNTKSFRFDEGLWCCKSSQNKCTVEKNTAWDTPLDAKCHGKVLTLAEQCNVEGNPICNHYPSDVDRNDYAPRSFLNLCQDNRTCVNETKICQGLPPLCSNHNDIKYCNATLWNQPSAAKWKPLWYHSKCNLLGESNKTEHGQWIKTTAFNDSTVDCLNRADVNPYVKIGTKPWQGNNNCTKKDYRRCIGQRSDQCIWAGCKFYM